MDWWRPVSGAYTIGDPPAIEDLTHDSRQVRPRGAFIAVTGAQNDGHDYIEAAVSAGASAVVVQADCEAKWGRFRGQIPVVVVSDSRAAMGPLAAEVYGQPSARLRLVGVTGTDGKTTTSHLTAHVLDKCGLACGYLTSVGFDTGGGFELNATHMTTLEATFLQSMLAKGLAQGRRAMVVEASSEGLAQHRLDGCAFDVAIFTNLSRDHLDFHGTMANYLAAKGLLFEMLGKGAGKAFPRAAVLNGDDTNSSYLRNRTTEPVIAYGEGEGVDLRATGIRTEGVSLAFTVSAGGKQVGARLPMIGRFNVHNSLAAVAAAHSQGVPVEVAVEALGSFPGVPGRLERIDCGQPFRVFVDIASTPAALENVLIALRPATPGRLWAVFGAAGGRDPARRDGMGRVAGRLADRCVITNEDPREEDPDAIIAAIAQGLVESGRTEESDFVRIPDRREALRHAFENAGPDDTVLLAGKATETTIIVGRDHIPWDERAVARALLEIRN